MTGRNHLTSNRCFAGLVCALLLLTPVISSEACPFFPGSSTPLTETLSQSEIAILGAWVSAGEGTLKKSGKTIFEVREIVHQADKSKLKVGTQITLNQHHPGKKGNLVLLLGTKKKWNLLFLLGAKGTSIDWSYPIEVTETSFHYISQAPTPKEKTIKRLRYFLKFLEYPDQMISNDAHAEFANATYEDIIPLAMYLPREKIRKWIVDPDTPVTRLGLYGLLLGLCAEESDIAFMEAKILETPKEFRQGIEGMMAGYLLQTGADGLDKIDEAKLIPKEAPFSETYAAMQAMRFMWYYGNGLIGKERLRSSMRRLLDRPDMADLAVANLAKWNDWSVLDRLMNMYGTQDRLMKMNGKGDYDIPPIKWAIVRYLLVASQGKNKKGLGPDPATAEKAKELLDKLRKEDPQTIKSVEHFFFIK